MSQPIQRTFDRSSGFRPAVMLVLAAVLFAAPASWSAEIVKVRVGNHPTFTRIVFELDGSAGYRVERKDGASPPQLVVTLDAGSKARSFQWKSAGITKVELTPGTDSSVARISLRKPGLRLKEMILANPSRIVIDVMREQPVVAASTEAKPTPEAKPSAPVEPKIAPVAQTPAPKTAPVAKTPAPKIVPVAKTSAPKITPVAKTPAPKITPVAKTPAPKITRVVKTPAPKIAPVAEVPAPKIAPVAEVPAPKVAPVAKTPVAPKPILRKPKLAKPAAPTTPTPTAKTDTASGWMSSPILLGAGVGMLLSVAGVVLLVRRRRPLPNDLDVTAIADAADAADAAPVSLMDTDATSDPMAGLFDDEPEEASSEVMLNTESTETPESTESPAIADVPLDDLFGGAESAPEPMGDVPMTQAMSDLPADPSHVEPPPPPAMASAPGADTDVLRVVHELEGRMAQLETKLEESNEARDRLERQVAAQSEELRVQRAAIARTQRALRTMSRGDEDKATEPALRDGDTQAKTRVVE
jgi:hypothetical protein